MILSSTIFLLHQSIDSLLCIILLLDGLGVMVGHLMLPPVPGRFGGKVTILESTAERSGVVVDNFVLFHLVTKDESFSTDITHIFLVLLTGMDRHHVTVKTPLISQLLSTLRALEFPLSTRLLMELQLVFVPGHYPADLAGPRLDIVSEFPVSRDLVRVDIVVAANVANISFGGFRFFLSQFDPIHFLTKLDFYQFSFF